MTAKLVSRLSLLTFLSDLFSNSVQVQGEGGESQLGSLLEELVALAGGPSLLRLLAAIGVLAATYFLTRFLGLLGQHFSRQRVAYGRGLIRFVPLLNLTAWVVGIWIAAFQILSGSRASLILLVVISALALGIASHRLLQDLVGSLVIALERPFRIGDRVQVGGLAGEVVGIGLRSFQLRAMDGSVTVVPASEVLRMSVTNVSPGSLEAQVSVNVLFPSDCDLEAAKRIASDAAVISPFTYLARPIEIHVEEEYRQEPLLSLTVKAYVFDARYAADLRSDIVELVRRGLQRHQAEKGPGAG